MSQNTLCGGKVKAMTKEEIIRAVSEIAVKIDESNRSELFAKETSKNDNKKIGSNQFRDIASLCRSAECYEEIELLIRYNMAKCDNNKSWKYVCSNGKAFGELILDGMKTIREKDKEEVLKNLELYFGYFYWQARIWAAESE